MNVLFLGHYRENSGVGFSCREFIRAIDSVSSFNLKIQPIDISGGYDDEYLRSLEKKNISKFDVCIQYLLPEYMVISGGIEKNIAICHIETIFSKNFWTEKLSLFDNVLVTNGKTKDLLTKQKIKSTYINHPTDIEKYKKEYKKPNNLFSPYYKFYTIFDYNKRKNIEQILRCFHSEFHRDEPVELIIKTNASREIIDSVTGNVRIGLNLYPEDNYIQEKVILDRLTEEEIYGLHKICDCFVTTSTGEGWSIPTFDAAAFGNGVVCPKIEPYTNYITGQINLEECNKTKYTCAMNMNTNFKTVFSGRDYLEECSDSEIKEAMRINYTYKVGNSKNKKSFNSKKFSYKNVGKEIERAVCLT